MKWKEYYEKSNNWAVSTTVSKMSSLEDMGTPDEIADVLICIASEDKKGATRLLNRALQHGVKFSGENLVEISVFCSEEDFQKAWKQSADRLTAQDLEDLYGCIDDELIMEVAKQYQIPVPADFADEHEEELCQDVTTPVTWSRFYDAFMNWNTEYAIARSQAISDFGPEDEVMEVICELFGEDENAASRFVIRALAAGVRFGVENLVELAGLCNKDTVKHAVLLSKRLLTEESLEELYGNVDDDVMIEVAKMRNLKLPEGLREEEKEVEASDDFEWNFQPAIEAADYALQCLYQAQGALKNSCTAGFIDRISKGFFASLWKFGSLTEADIEVQNARNALQNLNTELRNLSKHKSVKLIEYSQLASAIDLWVDSGFMDGLMQLQINKTQKKIKRTIKQVEAIKRELQRALSF